MATCKNCGRPLILNGGKCIYCGTPVVKEPFHRNNIQQVHDSTIYQAVDLALPSGTKWSPCNVGAKNPWEYGGYYAWGEKEEKNTYNRQTYRWGAFSPNWKYCNDAFCDVVDNKWVLEPEDDVAHIKWGGGWRMPTLEDYNELIYNCFSEWAVLNNVRGLKLVSKNNGKSIFFPAAGLRMDSNLINQDYGYYRSSSLYETNHEDAYVFIFVSEKNSQSKEIYINPNLRELGQSIRPVCL